MIENLPVIARDGEAPECYVGGDADFVLRAMNSAPVAERLYQAAKEFMRIADRDTTECNALRTAIAEYEKAKEVTQPEEFNGAEVFLRN